jgi:7-cyano-7-deazaguanine synthase
MEGIVLSLSGGLDSTTLLAYLMDGGYSPHPVFFKYLSKHNKYELEAARKIAEYYNLPLTEIDVSDIFSKFTSNLLQSGGDIPEGHYEDKSMELTVVPSRNIIFLSVLSGYAWSMGDPTIAIGIHSGDHAIYPDCRPEFRQAMHLAISFGTGGRVGIVAPFETLNKTEILKWGLQNGVPYQLTRTCYKDQIKSCGKCGSCNERLEAFSSQGRKDPIEYEDNGG